MDQDKKVMNIDSSESFTYVVKQNKYTITDDMEENKSEETGIVYLLH